MNVIAHYTVVVHECSGVDETIAPEGRASLHHCASHDLCALPEPNVSCDSGRSVDDGAEGVARGVEAIEYPAARSVGPDASEPVCQLDCRRWAQRRQSRVGTEYGYPIEGKAVLGGVGVNEGNDDARTAHADRVKQDPTVATGPDDDDLPRRSCVHPRVVQQVRQMSAP